jgi:hypothetical protein
MTQGTAADATGAFLARSVVLNFRPRFSGAARNCLYNHGILPGWNTSIMGAVAFASRPLDCPVGGAGANFPEATPCP